MSSFSKKPLIIITFTIYIKFLHGYSEESTLDYELGQNTKYNSTLAKAHHIDCLILGYYASDEISLLNNDISTTINDRSKSNFDPAKIIKSGLKDTIIINTAMNFLHIRGRLLVDNVEGLKNSDIFIDFEQPVQINKLMINNKNIRISNDYDNNLHKIGKTVIASGKSIWQNDENTNIINKELPDLYIIQQNDIRHDTYLETSIMKEFTDPLIKFAKNLNKEQKKAYYFVYVITAKEITLEIYTNYLGYCFILLAQEELENLK